MVDLVTAERANAGLAAVRLNDKLNDSSEAHSQWMLDSDTFNHVGANGSSASDRVESAGYKLEGSARVTENIGWQSERGAEGIEDDVRDIHESLMNSPRHRENILDPDVDEIGIGIERGEFKTNGQPWDAVMVTQNYGRTDADDPAPAASPPEEQAVSAVDAPAEKTPLDELSPKDGLTTETTSSRSVATASSNATTSSDGDTSTSSKSCAARSDSDGDDIESMSMESRSMGSDGADAKSATTASVGDREIDFDSVFAMAARPDAGQQGAAVSAANAGASLDDGGDARSIDAALARLAGGAGNDDGQQAYSGSVQQPAEWHLI
ncbi:MAG: CAP domain-containing protein [Beijerinckiaceae bacterium]